MMFLNRMYEFLIETLEVLFTLIHKDVLLF